MVQLAKAKSETLCYSYTMVFPSVRGDNPRALARGLSSRTDRQPWYVIYVTVACNKIVYTKVGNGGIKQEHQFKEIILGSYVETTLEIKNCFLQDSSKFCV